MAGWLVVADDFLLDPHDGSGVPVGAMDEDAVRIVRAFADWRQRTCLVSSADPDALKHWAAARGLAGWDDVVGNEDDLLAAARVKRDQYGGVNLVLTGDPTRVRDLLMAGFRVVSLATPVYLHDEHRPDYEGSVRPWAAVAAQHTGDKALHDSDPRRRDDNSERFTE